MHINIRSHNNYFDNLHNLLSYLKFSPSIVAISEIRLKNQPITNISIPVYSFVHVDSASNAGDVAAYISIRGYSFVYVDSASNAGDVAAYISNSIQFQLHKKQFHLHNCESIWLTANNNKTKFIVEMIY